MSEANGGEEAYTNWGFGTANNVGPSASWCSVVYAYASSMMFRSPVNPRPEPFDRAMNLMRCSVSSRSNPSSPFVLEILMWMPSTTTRLSLTFVPSAHSSDRIRRNASIDVLYSCADHMISASPSSRNPARALASRIAPFPFCREQISQYSKHAHRPSSRNASSNVTASCCHWSSGFPARSISAMASGPKLSV